MKGFLIVVGLGAALGACSAEAFTPQVIATPYRGADFARYTGPGPVSLSGQAFLRTVGGDVKTCAGNVVKLIPATAYNAAVAAHATDILPVKNLDPRAASFTRTATCDAQGNFSFDKVPEGKWFVQTEVTWGVPRIGTGLFGPEVKTDQQGGELMRQVELQPGTNKIILSENDEK